jgi:hypothetical protein
VVCFCSAQLKLDWLCLTLVMSTGLSSGIAKGGGGGGGDESPHSSSEPPSRYVLIR